MSPSFLRDICRYMMGRFTAFSTLADNGVISNPLKVTEAVSCSASDLYRLYEFSFGTGTGRGRYFAFRNPLIPRAVSLLTLTKPTTVGPTAGLSALLRTKNRVRLRDSAMRYKMTTRDYRKFSTRSIHFERLCCEYPVLAWHFGDEFCIYQVT